MIGKILLAANLHVGSQVTRIYKIEYEEEIKLLFVFICLSAANVF